MATNVLDKIIAQLRALEAVQDGALDRLNGERAPRVSKPTFHRRTRFLGEQESTTGVGRTFALAEDTHTESADSTRERFDSPSDRQQTVGEP